MFNNILVPYDGSRQAQDAFKMAIDLAKESQNTTIKVVKIVDAKALSQAVGAKGGETFDSNITIDVDPTKYNSQMEAGIAAAQAILTSDINELAKDYTGPVETTVLPSNDPARRIVEFADGNDIDLIIMGRRGLGAIRGMLGSVSTAVLRDTPIPVLTVK